jgi:hypothetical protein
LLDAVAIGHGVGEEREGIPDETRHDLGGHQAEDQSEGDREAARIRLAAGDVRVVVPHVLDYPRSVDGFAT